MKQRKEKDMKYLYKAAALLTIICVLACATVTTANISSNDATIESALDMFLQNQEQSNIMYNRLLQSFTEDGKYGMEEHYPEYYGGAYIDNNGYLVILVKNATQLNIDEVRAICGESGYEIKTASFSMNELIEAKNQFSQNALSKRSSGVKFVSISIREEQNKIFVGISDLNDGINSITKNINSNMFEIYECSAKLQEFSSFKPGDSIDADCGGSAGYGATLSINGTKKTGFITAAHVTNGSDVYTGWTHINKLGNTIVEKNSGSVDAAFVELTNCHTFNNKIDGYSITPNVSVIPAPNSIVYKIGSQSGTTSGKIISNINETTWEINGSYYTFTNLCETDVSCVSGDSGGLMYTKSGTTYKVIGTIKGGGGGLFYATKHSSLPWKVDVS